MNQRPISENGVRRLGPGPGPLAEYKSQRTRQWDAGDMKRGSDRGWGRGRGRGRGQWGKGSSQHRTGTKTTGFVGYLLGEGDLKTRILAVHKSMATAFRGWEPQPYPHTTMIYLGKSFVEDTEKLLADERFRQEIAKFKGAVCEFDRVDFLRTCLVFVYKFRDPGLASALTDLTHKYERQAHTQFLHITLGSMTEDEKATFLRDRTAVTAMFRGATFTIDSPTVIRVEHPAKSYHQYKGLV